MTLPDVALAAVVVCAFALIICRLLTALTTERTLHERQTERLVQRLQAPAVAVAQFVPADDSAESPEEPTEEEMRVFHNEQDEILHQVGRL